MLGENNLCGRFSITVWSMAATATRWSMWRRCSKSAVCCSISVKLPRFPPRKLQRIDQIFVSHAHIDHFIGLDHLLRLLVGRETSVHLYGPLGMAEHVYHKLQGYRLDLVESYNCELISS